MKFEEDDKKCFRAKCDSHDWESMSYHNESDAQKDLDAHLEFDPDEDCDGAEIIKVNCSGRS